MSLTVRALVPAHGLDVDLHLGHGERLAVVGPNGAGKSTLLGVLAGVVRPERGRALLDGRVLFDVAGHSGVWVPPHARGVALLAQDPLLFPRLTVAQNVAFGPRAAGLRRHEARQVAHGWLEQVEATDLADRRPGRLSGGQAQRVAIARALATRPRLLLLDEPLAALDVEASALLRRMLRRVLSGRTAIVVTHDLLDALLLSDRVVVLDGGHVVESGPTTEVLRRPRSAFAARIAGLNMLAGTADGSGLRQPDGQRVDGMASSPTSPGEPAVAVFSPEAVAVYDAAPHGSPRNVFAATVTEVEPRSERVRVRGTIGSGAVVVADVTPAAVAELDLYQGRAAFFAVKAVSVQIYPA
jgi:molybdate transport system ATP-binding protein